MLGCKFILIPNCCFSLFYSFIIGLSFLFLLPNGFFSAKLNLGLPLNFDFNTTRKFNVRPLAQINAKRFLPRPILPEGEHEKVRRWNRPNSVFLSKSRHPHIYYSLKRNRVNESEDISRKSEQFNNYGFIQVDMRPLVIPINHYTRETTANPMKEWNGTKVDVKSKPFIEINNNNSDRKLSAVYSMLLYNLLFQPRLRLLSGLTSSLNESLIPSEGEDNYIPKANQSGLVIETTTPQNHHKVHKLTVCADNTVKPLTTKSTITTYTVNSNVSINITKTATNITCSNVSTSNPINCMLTCNFNNPTFYANKIEKPLQRNLTTWSCNNNLSTTTRSRPDTTSFGTNYKKDSSFRWYRKQKKIMLDFGLETTEGHDNIVILEDDENSTELPSENLYREARYVNTRKKDEVENNNTQMASKYKRSDKITGHFRTAYCFDEGICYRTIADVRWCDDSFCAAGERCVSMDVGLRCLHVNEEAKRLNVNLYMKV